MKITLNKLNIVLIYCLVIFSLISLLERSDYYNLALSLLIVYYFIINKSWNVIKHIMKFILLFGIAIKLDLVWFAFPIAEIASLILSTFFFRKLYRSTMAAF